MSRPIFFLALSLIVLAISASTSAASAVPTDIEEDSRPFLKTFPQKHQDDSSVFSRVLQSLKFRGNDRNEYGECEGDCDRDRDCASGLKCFQRDGLKSVPGCRGDGIRDVDYCVADKDDNGDDDDDDDWLFSHAVRVTSTLTRRAPGAHAWASFRVTTTHPSSSTTGISPGELLVPTLPPRSLISSILGGSRYSR
mmetsp:Transcript_16235/g.35306  ORF Transcript_16235/g.35306 Transcript_16235/m.35306 type:complete len:195 (+) Transcript_16235:243-827(+)